MSLTADLLHDCDVNVIPGVSARLSLVCACDVDTWPDYLATTGPGDSVTLDGDIVLKPTKKFIQFDIIPDTGELKNTLGGNRGSKSYSITVDGKTYNTGPEVDEFFEKNKNACIIALVKEKSGPQRAIGTPTDPAYFEAAESTSGMGPDSAKEWSFQLKATPGSVAAHYNGLIDLTA